MKGEKEFFKKITIHVDETADQDLNFIAGLHQQLTATYNSVSTIEKTIKLVNELIAESQNIQGKVEADIQKDAKIFALASKLAVNLRILVPYSQDLPSVEASRMLPIQDWSYAKLLEINKMLVGNAFLMSLFWGNGPHFGIAGPGPLDPNLYHMYINQLRSGTGPENKKDANENPLPEITQPQSSQPISLQRTAIDFTELKKLNDRFQETIEKYRPADLKIKINNELHERVFKSLSPALMQVNSESKEFKEIEIYLFMSWPDFESKIAESKAFLTDAVSKRAQMISSHVSGPDVPTRNAEEKAQLLKENAENLRKLRILYHFAQVQPHLFQQN